MKRRPFGLLAGTSLASAAAWRPAWAQSSKPDPNLLKTTLTPLGAERAGNADGSIPAWTGGVVAPPLPEGQAAPVQMFADEQPLYTVDASNMAQYESLLTEGVRTLMTTAGFKIRVFQTHRTAAAPQYVYDNTAQNATRAQLLPQGGRFGFSGGYGGPPFPIIDTSDPMVAGAQLIWNHLVRWAAYGSKANYSGDYAVINGQPILTFGGTTFFISPYYDPNGSLETYDGYFTKRHVYTKAPPEANGQEEMVWTATNVLFNPDIVWSLLNGQGRVRKDPNEAYDTPDPVSNGIRNVDDASCYAGSPQKYDWKYIAKQEMLVPYNCNAIYFTTYQDLLQPNGPNPDVIRWEKHRIWVLEANLHPGESNTSPRRRLYIDEDTWTALLADNYDADNKLVKTSALYNYCVPSVPGTFEVAESAWNLQSGGYDVVGNMQIPPHSNAVSFGPQAATLFDVELMAANASF